TWKLFRIRTDKDLPNPEWGVKKVIDSIKDNVTENELVELCMKEPIISPRTAARRGSIVKLLESGLQKEEPQSSQDKPRGRGRGRGHGRGKGSRGRGRGRSRGKGQNNDRQNNRATGHKRVVRKFRTIANADDTKE